MLSLPVEICYEISRYLNHRDYIRLRRTCKILSGLDSIQYLYFQSYVESVDLIGNHPKLPSQIRLDNQCLDDDSFLYIAFNGHSGEFLRLYHTKAIDKISVKAKEKAFVAIINNNGLPEMICKLLMDGFVDATLSVTFLDQENQDVEGTALHWACIYDYLDFVQLLLKYDNVDVCSTDSDVVEPIHHAALNGHTESYTF
jgi:hypothetical protein